MTILMPKDVEGLTNAVVRSLERTPIRTRESNVTRSAWRMEVECDSGTGTITLLDEGLHRGDGLFLGWPRERLAATYEALVAGDQDDSPAPDTLQLG